jgi:hypothetical protein
LVAEILSAIAVVCSLVFVGLQVRQGAEETAFNTRAIQAHAYQELTSDISTLNQVVIDNPEFALTWQRLLRGEPPQTETENAQATAYLFMVYRHGELAFIQYKNGLLEESGLRGVLYWDRFLRSRQLTLVEGFGTACPSTCRT